MTSHIHLALLEFYLVFVNILLDTVILLKAVYHKNSFR